LPSATEIVSALGRGADLRGRSYACDYPGAVVKLPVIIKSVIDPENMSPREIDDKVRDAARAGSSLHEIDARLLLEAAPDLIFAQELCDVCAPSESLVREAQDLLKGDGRVVYLNPTSLEGIFESIIVVGESLSEKRAAEDLVRNLRGRVDAVKKTLSGAKRGKVFMLEHPDPPFSSGHWVPDQVDAAGGIEVFGRRGLRSIRLEWKQIAEKDPDLILIAGCGYHMKDIPSAIKALRLIPEWMALRAVRERRVIGVDGDSYFARPGPRVVDGIELLGNLLHPDKIAWDGPSAFDRNVLAAG